jgi:hypothetical protein
MKGKYGYIPPELLEELEELNVCIEDLEKEKESGDYIEGLGDFED